MHYMEAGAGFLSDVDKMLMIAANIESCSIRKEQTVPPILLDEMQDLLFDKTLRDDDWLY